MPEKCAQGQINANEISSLRDVVYQRNAEISTMRQQMTDGFTSLKVSLEKMDGKLNRALEKADENKLKLDAHLKDSDKRIDEISYNSAFRKIGFWVIGLIMAVVGWVSKTLVG